MNHRRNLANQCNALKSTGPKSATGKRVSSQNSRKHGLNSAPDFESSLEYKALVDLIAGEGFSAFVCADIAAGLLNYRRVMDAYYDTYTSPEPVDKFLRDMDVRASIPIFRELLIPSGSKPQDVKEMATFFADMQRQERRKGGPVSRRSMDTHKLIRYQRNAIARLSRAVRQG
ncbi:hypothetical protein OAD96_01750 [Pseudomonadales bacterium]|nr:hypothetical protein [Pseudomonadales bacterium]